MSNSKISSFFLRSVFSSCFSLFFYSLFSRERAHLQAQARSGVARGILDTFYNYDQVRKAKRISIQKSIFNRLAFHLVTRNGYDLSNTRQININR